MANPITRSSPMIFLVEYAEYKDMLPAWISNTAASIVTMFVMCFI